MLYVTPFNYYTLWLYSLYREYKINFLYLRLNLIKIYVIIEISLDIINIIKNKK